MLADLLLMLLMLTGMLVGAGLVFLLITRNACAQAKPADAGRREASR